MAEHGGTTEFDLATGNDYAEHRRTYAFFIGLVKWGTIAVAILVILLAIFTY